MRSASDSSVRSLSGRAQRVSAISSTSRWFTAVRISPDFGYAKVYVSIFPFDRSAATMKEIEHQNWFIRRALGQRIRNQVKNVPELQFFLDDSLEYIEHIEEALKHDKPE